MIESMKCREMQCETGHMDSGTAFSPRHETMSEQLIHLGRLTAGFLRKAWGHWYNLS